MGIIVFVGLISFDGISLGFIAALSDQRTKVESTDSITCISSKSYLFRTSRFF